MAQVTYNTEKVSKKRVYYTGTDTLYEGYPLCYDWDTTTGGSDGESNPKRVLRVEQPKAANMDMLAGVVASGHGGKKGPCWLDIIEPDNWPTGRLVRAWTDVNCTQQATRLGLVGDTWALQAASSSNPMVATSMETTNRSGVAGAVDVLFAGAGYVEKFTQSVPALTGATTGQTVLISFSASTPDLIGGTTGATVLLTGLSVGGSWLSQDEDVIAGLKRNVDGIVKTKADIASLYALIQRNTDALVANTTDMATLQTNMKTAHLTER